MQTQTDRLTAERPPGLPAERAPSPHPAQEAPRTAALFVERRRLSEDAPAGATASGLAEALRRIRPAVEKLLIANKVPPINAYELLLAALRNVAENLEGSHLDRCLLQEIHRGLSGWRDQARLWKEQAASWVDLLVQTGLIPKADRTSWLRTFGAPKR